MTSIDIYTSIKPTYLYIKQHSITGLKYFGKTTRDPYKYNGSGSYWSRHIKKHGKEHIVTLWISELYYDTSIVDYALQLSREYNIVESSEWANLIPEDGLYGGSVKGRVSPNKGKKFSEETKQKISKSNKGKKFSEETKQKISKSNKGKKFSEETKQKMSIAKKGRYSGRICSDETKQKISNAKKGIPSNNIYSDETKQKISNAKKGIPSNNIYSDETKQKMSYAQKGRVHSNETKQKMSESRKGRIISNETRKKISETTKNKPKSKTICPHCSKIGSISNMIRWHFDNCKLKI